MNQTIYDREHFSYLKINDKSFNFLENDLLIEIIKDSLDKNNNLLINAKNIEELNHEDALFLNNIKNILKTNQTIIISELPVKYMKLISPSSIKCFDNDDEAIDELFMSDVGLQSFDDNWIGEELDFDNEEQ